MAACHPTPAIQHLQPQESPQLGLGPMNAAGNQGQKPIHQPHYSPHLLNWVYLAIADQNSAQTRDQVLQFLSLSLCVSFLPTTFVFDKKKRSEAFQMIQWPTKIFKHL